MARATAKSPAKVDVLLPYWGDFGLLKIAVESVLAQTEQDWSLLIVDDCYPSDEAANYFKDFPDKRVSYHRHKENLGLVKNFNYVLDQATAEYCVIFGCDDIMLPNYLETALATIGNADYYQPGVEVIDDAGAVYLPLSDRLKHILRPGKPGVYRGEPVVSRMCHGNWLYFPSILWRTKTLKRYGFDNTKGNTQDVITEIAILKDGGAVYVDNTITFQYRRSSTSFSSKAKSGSRFSEENQTYRELADEFAHIGWKKASRSARLHITSRLYQLLP